MVAIKALTVLALAGAISAIPVAQSVGEPMVRREAEAEAHRVTWGWRWGNGSGNSNAQPAAAPAAPASTPASTPAAEQPAAEQPAASVPQSSGSSSGSDAPAAAAPSSAPSTPSTGSSGGSGYIGIVNEYRSKMNLPALTEDNSLQSNAQDAATSANGQLVHKLNPGSMAQVMAPGDSSNFESVFVGGWLCEIPSLLGASVCDSASQGWNHAGQTGHAKILTSGDYSKIGCALGQSGVKPEIWSCDLA